MGRGGKSIRGGYRGAESATASSSKKHYGGPKRPQLTHFLCLPLVTKSSRPQLEGSLADFRGLLAAHNTTSDSTTAVPLNAIRPVGSIHLTLGVMSLSSIDRVSEAIGFLQTLDLKAVAQQALPEKSGENQSSLRISLRSLVSMHPPRRTSILYAEPSDPSNILQPISIQLRDAFSKAGFLVPDDRRLKLHATILNTIYAKASRRSDNTGVSPASTESAQNKAMDESKHKSQNEADNAPDTSRGHGRNAKAPIQLDATSIIEECRDFNWASDFALEKIAICKMGATKIKDEEGNVIDEQYEEVASIPFEI